MVTKRRTSRTFPVQTAIYDYIGPPELPPPNIITASNVAYGNITNTAAPGSISVENFDSSQQDIELEENVAYRPVTVSH